MQRRIFFDSGKLRLAIRPAKDYIERAVLRGA